MNTVLLGVFGVILSICVAFGTWGSLYMPGTEISLQLLIAAVVGVVAGALVPRSLSASLAWPLLVVVAWIGYGWAVFKILPTVMAIPFLSYPVAASVAVAAGMMARRMSPESTARKFAPLVLGAAAIVGIFLSHGQLKNWGRAWAYPENWQPEPFVLQLADGNRVASQSLRGETVVLSFWATWCAPCREELPALQRVYTVQYADSEDVRFFLVNEDSGEGAAAIAASWLRKHDITMTSVLDPEGELEARLQTDGLLPARVVVGPQGAVILATFGYSEKDSEFPELRSAIAGAGGA